MVVGIGTAAAGETDRKGAAAVREWTGETPAMGESPEIELVRRVVKSQEVV
jgi:hypothetical protein